jgi:ribosomal-protein-alanine N-acetyltransferase
MIENTPQIVPMTGEHLPEVLAIEKSCFRDPWSPVCFLDSMGEPQACWVMLDDGRVTAYIVTLWVLDEIHLLNIAVREDLRLRGIGAHLMEFLFEKAHARGIRMIILDVRRSNQAAIRLYEKCGFQLLYERKAYYSDGEDAWVMECEILPKKESDEGSTRLHPDQMCLSR